MPRSKEELIGEIPSLDTMGFRTLNRCYLHPEDKRCCSKCYKIFEGILENFHIKKYYEDGSVGYQSTCKNCFNSTNRERTKEYRKNAHHFIRARFTSYKNRAKKEGLSFNLTAEKMIEQWDAQQGVCFYTEKAISFLLVTEKGKHPHNWTPSLDRLNPNLGYTVGNVVWCAYAINRMKNDFEYDDFVETCKLIINTRERHK